MSAADKPMPIGPWWAGLSLSPSVWTFNADMFVMSYRRGGAS